MLTIMGIVGQRNEIALEGLSFSAKKHMTGPPRRIEKIEVTIQMPSGLNSEYRKKLENAALTCPVKNSLGDNVSMPVVFDYPD